MGALNGNGAKRRDENEIEFSRIVAFSDGVFAIAITLLVLNLGIPKGLGEGEVAGALWDQREQLGAFAVSFAVIGRFWVIHHRFFGAVTAFDARTIVLNLGYLALIVLIPFSSEVLGEYAGTTAATVLYAVNIGAVVLMGAVMSAYAHRRGMTELHPEAQRAATARSLYFAAVFALSIPVAFLAPEVAPWVWLFLLLGPTRLLGPRRADRQPPD